MARFFTKVFWFWLLIVALSAYEPGGCVAADGGEWKSRTQIVFDNAEKHLVRQTFIVWDDHPEFNLDFLWEQPNGSVVSEPAKISGIGVLTWRRPGFSDYDQKSIYSVYRGEMQDGRYEGKGTLQTETGFSYSGDWHNSLMHGQGILKLENGDQYEGRFVEGLLNGEGRYVSADGTETKGIFRKAKYPIMEPTKEEVKLASTQRFYSETGTKTRGGSPDGIRLAQSEAPLQLRVFIDRTRNDKFLRDYKAEAEIQSYAYDGTFSEGVLKVQLASKRIVGDWEGNNTIVPLNYRGDGYFEDFTQFAPVFLLADVTNKSNRSIEIESAFLSVDESIGDNKPYIELTKLTEDFSGAAEYNANFDLVNYGWSAVSNPTLNFSLGNGRSRVQELTLDLPDFDQKVSVSLENALSGLGVNVERLKRGKFVCGSAAQVPQCLRTIENSGVLGQLAGRVFAGYNGANVGQIYTNLSGELRYSWIDARRERHESSSRISFVIPLFYFEGLAGAELGGPAPVDRSPKTIKLAVDEDNYRIPLGWRDEIASNQSKRFSLALVADKSSRHRFSINIATSDGRTWQSPKVDLTYFLPRIPPADQQ